MAGEVAWGLSALPRSCTSCGAVSKHWLMQCREGLPSGWPCLKEVNDRRRFLWTELVYNMRYHRGLLQCLTCAAVCLLNKLPEPKHPAALQVKEAIQEELSESTSKHRSAGSSSKGISTARYSRLEAETGCMQRDSATYCDEPQASSCASLAPCQGCRTALIWNK